MTDPVEAGRPVEEPEEVRRGRGWAIDTAPLRIPAFRRLFGGVAATMLGQQMTLVAVPFQVYELTGSSLLVGVTSIVALVPLIVFGLLGGAIADAMDRRKLMLITSAGAAGTSALLAVQALLPGGGNLVLLWVLTACVSGFAAVNQPTRSAVIPALVGPSGVAEGFAFLRTQPVLLMTFVVDVIAMTFAWPQAVFPELSQTRFAESPNSLGWLFAGISIGALVMGLSSGWVTRVDRQGAVVLAAIVAWGIAIIGFGFAPALWVAVACLAVAGAADMVSAVLRTSMLQLAAPEEMRGRMQGVFIVVVAGGPRLGDLRAGAVATAASVTVAMVSGGLVIVVAMIVVALLVPSFWLFRASRSAAETRPASPAPESGEDRPGTSAA